MWFAFATHLKHLSDRIGIEHTGNQETFAGVRWQLSRFSVWPLIFAQVMIQDHVGLPAQWSLILSLSLSLAPPLTHSLPNKQIHLFLFVCFKVFAKGGLLLKKHSIISLDIWLRSGIQAKGEKIRKNGSCTQLGSADWVPQGGTRGPCVALSLFVLEINLNLISKTWELEKDFWD